MKIVLSIISVFAFCTAAYGAKQTINNGETMGQARTKINSNFTEVYTQMLVGDCTVGPCLDGTADGGTIIKLWAGTGDKWTALQGGAPDANRSWRLPIAAPPVSGATQVMTMDQYGQMAFMGLPDVSGKVLSSTTAGVLSWETGGSGSFDEAGDYTPTGEWDFSGATVTGLSGGSMVYPGAGIPNSTGSAWGTSYALDTDLSSVSASDDTLPSAKATKAALDGKANATGISFVASTLSDLKYDPDVNTASDEYNLITNTGSVGDANDATVVPTLERAGALFQGLDADLTTAAGAGAASNSTYFGKNAGGTVGFHALPSGSGFTPSGNWQVFYSNGSATMTELPIGAAGTVLKSNGTASAPSWESDATGTGGAGTGNVVIDCGDATSSTCTASYDGGTAAN